MNVKGAWGSEDALSHLEKGGRGGGLGVEPPKKFLVFKEHLDWLKIITVQDYKCTKN